MKWKRFITIGILFLISIILIYFFYEEEKEVEERNKLIIGLTEFYKNDYYSILDTKSTYYCNIYMNVRTSDKLILMDSYCNATYPYSAIEAFLAVGRGNISADGSTHYTGLGWVMSEAEAVKKRLQFIESPFVAERPNETSTSGITYLCHLPCLDGNSPASFDVLSVNYNPDKEGLSRLFQDYNLEKFRGLTVYSEYSYIVYYNSADHMFEWRYFVGQFDLGKFNLKIEFDKPILNITNRRDEIQTVVEIPKENYEVVKLSENVFSITGAATAVDKLVIRW